MTTCDLQLAERERERERKRERGHPPFLFAFAVEGHVMAFAVACLSLVEGILFRVASTIVYLLGDPLSSVQPGSIQSE